MTSPTGLTRYTVAGIVYAEGQDARGDQGPFYLAADVARRDAEIEKFLRSFHCSHAHYKEAERLLAMLEGKP